MNFDFRESCLEVAFGLRTKLPGDKNRDVTFKDGVEVCRGWLETGQFPSCVCCDYGMKSFQDCETIEAVECVKEGWDMVRERRQA